MRSEAEEGFAAMWVESVMRRDAVEGRSGDEDVADRIMECSIARICWKVALGMWGSDGRLRSRIKEGGLGADSGSKMVVTIEMSLRVRLLTCAAEECESMRADIKVISSTTAAEVGPRVLVTFPCE